MQVYILYNRLGKRYQHSTIIDRSSEINKWYIFVDEFLGYK